MCTIHCPEDILRQCPATLLSDCKVDLLVLEGFLPRKRLLSRSQNDKFSLLIQTLLENILKYFFWELFYIKTAFYKSNQCVFLQKWITVLKTFKILTIHLDFIVIERWKHHYSPVLSYYSFPMIQFLSSPVFQFFCAYPSIRSLLYITSGWQKIVKTV